MNLWIGIAIFFVGAIVGVTLAAIASYGMFEEDELNEF